MRLKLFLKALFGRLSTNELERLVFMLEKGGFVVKLIFKIYFRYHADRLSTEDIEVLTETENKWIWKLLANSLARASQNRDVAQKVAQLPLQVFKQLSRPLSNSCVKSLFDQNIIDKLFWYVRVFYLSPKNEERLVIAVETLQKYPYAEVLNAYLQHNKSKYVFYYPASQHALMGLGAKYLKLLIDRFNIYNEPSNLLLYDILQTGDENLIRRLLFRTVIFSHKVREQILSRYPDLKLAVEISELRRRFRLNNRMVTKYGVCNLFLSEQENLKELIDSKDRDNRSLIIGILRKEKFHSLSFWAWFVYRYPEFQELVSIRFYDRFL